MCLKPLILALLLAVGPHNVYAQECVFGSINCGQGSICLSPFAPLECAYDGVTKLTQYFSLLKDPIDLFTDAVGTAIDTGATLVDDALKDVQTCVRGLSGDPSCSKLETASGCVNTALNALPLAKASKAYKTLSASKKASISKAAKASGNIISKMEEICRVSGACVGNTCSGVTLSFSPPTGCECQSLSVDGYSTASVCAANTLNSKTGGKIYNEYFGCYVGLNASKPKHGHGGGSGFGSCQEAYSGNGNPVSQAGGWFVRCEDQFGNTGRTSSATIMRASWAIMVLCILSLFA